jgi:hypothetical protein
MVIWSSSKYCLVAFFCFCFCFLFLLCCFFVNRRWKLVYLLQISKKSRYRRLILSYPPNSIVVPTQLYCRIYPTLLSYPHNSIVVPTQLYCRTHPNLLSYLSNSIVVPTQLYCRTYPTLLSYPPNSIVVPTQLYCFSLKSKVVALVDPSIPYTVYNYCCTCFRPEYFWNTARWTLNNNHSQFNC